MQNPHGVEPTRFIKREESRYAIQCTTDRGPIFGNEIENGSDILIGNYCNRKNSCWIDNDGTRGYECHSEYKSSLFVNTGGPNEKSYFAVLDYEVYGIDYRNQDNIYKLCKYPDVLWEYLQSKDMSEELLKGINDSRGLLSDLDTICCRDNAIRLKIYRYYFRDPSELFPSTTIVEKRYDRYLKEWAGDYSWKLLYRASKHEYTAESFHEYCDNKGPTLVIMMSSIGWIFGGYTTQSWSGHRIYI